MRLSQQATLDELREDLARIEPSLKRDARSESELLQLIMSPVRQPTAEMILAEENDLVTEHPENSGRTGFQALEDNEVAICVMAGRLGHVLEPIPGLGISAMTFKMAQGILGAWGKTFTPPMWIVVSPEERDEVERHLNSVVVPNAERIHLVDQRESYLFDPMKRILFEEPGVPVVGPLGTGDVPKALMDDGCFSEFVDNGGRYIVFMNANNLMAAPDIAVIGHHIERGADITAEVVKREAGMIGGTVVWAGNTLTVTEDSEWDSPPFGDEGYLSTNSFIMNVEAIAQSSRVPWSFNRQRRSVDGRIVDCFESYISQLTAHFKTDYIEMPPDVRYLPIRTPEDIGEVLEVFKDLGLVTME